MWIKICANTNLEDARLAADLGADALGFVFAPSPRQVTPAQVRAIAAGLPPAIERIGIFQTGDAGEIRETFQAAALTGIQLHGGFDLGLVRGLRDDLGDDVPITPVLHWDTSALGSGETLRSGERLRTELRQLREAPGIDRVMIDSKVGQATGGTGITFDWDAAADLLAAELGHLKLIIAGGLNPSNVNLAIERLRPWGVDVASGVESFPGSKDPKKLEAFLRKASLRSCPA